MQLQHQRSLLVKCSTCAAPDSPLSPYRPILGSAMLLQLLRSSDPIPMPYPRPAPRSDAQLGLLLAVQVSC